MSVLSGERRPGLDFSVPLVPEGAWAHSLLVTVLFIPNVKTEQNKACKNQEQTHTESTAEMSRDDRLQVWLEPGIWPRRSSVPPKTVTPGREQARFGSWAYMGRKCQHPSPRLYDSCSGSGRPQMETIRLLLGGGGRERHGVPSSAGR